MYDQTKRRKTASKEGEGKSAAVANKADSGSGRGRVTLAQTIVVGTDPYGGRRPITPPHSPKPEVA